MKRRSQSAASGSERGPVDWKETRKLFQELISNLRQVPEGKIDPVDPPTNPRVLLAGDDPQFRYVLCRFRRPEHELSPREREIIHLVAAGLGDKAIWDQLSFSEGTLHTHLSRMKTKLKASSRAELALLSLLFREKLIPEG